MVDPSRIRHRIEFEVASSSEPTHVYIDVKSDEVMRWYLALNLRDRRFHLIGSVRGGRLLKPTQQGRMKDYLVSALP